MYNLFKSNTNNDKKHYFKNLNLFSTAKEKKIKVLEISKAIQPLKFKSRKFR